MSALFRNPIKSSFNDDSFSHHKIITGRKFIITYWNGREKVNIKYKLLHILPSSLISFIQLNWIQFQWKFLFKFRVLKNKLDTSFCMQRLAYCFCVFWHCATNHKAFREHSDLTEIINQKFQSAPYWPWIADYRGSSEHTHTHSVSLSLLSSPLLCPTYTYTKASTCLLLCSH